MQTAVAYLRTSSLTNVSKAADKGTVDEKDSERRQREAIHAYAERAGLSVVQEFADPGISGADQVEARPGFAALLRWCAEHNVKTVLCESASRFARDLMVQETGYAALKRQGFVLIAVDSPDSFVADGPTATLIRQVLGAVAGYDKAALVAKLRGARDRKSAALGRRCEVRHGYDLTRPELVSEAHALNDGRSLRAISAELALRSYGVTATGKAFSPSQVQRLLSYSVARAA